ncbi:MAG: restriction endonuclease subunit R [Verrucomicrobia bacterium]|nr:MAG: restriction endonuclease subunit R [Verrucomicrobiota bacterium]TAE88175.1 MAG: restriction endonuclease subunit R [Verrucomicrobiota bacterium]TAF26059.1 MAG: restriction endonuclease subunit R [Verrucomicrobiota bacterium]TAF41016.1 MAG: restriction endonuclease subunit R [Verrucomicrobiota bacterium]
MPARVRSTVPPLPFDKKLVLQQWVFSLLEARDLYDLCDSEFRHPDAEKWDTENVTEFHRLLVQKTIEREHLPHALLRAFDENIVRHTMAINGRRKEPIRWKYYQYIALLFTEIYLHWYFHKPAALLAALNARIATFNAGLENTEHLLPCTEADLKKLCFWQATGSGKTLQMHVNILQYLDHLARAGRRHELNKIILLTPKEGLSLQHLKEFADSGIDAELFEKEGTGSMFSGQTVEIIDVNKLADESKDKTVAVDCFEGNNLVLVDEGHRGSSGEEWMKRREKLCRDGFCFEYSATFGQAVKAATPVKGDDGIKRNLLEQNYARWILFDYSYRFFHGDGYGKHYRILNLREQRDDDQRQLYLVAGLLSFYQQLRVWADHRDEFSVFNVERPLWVFFGAKVNAGEISDIVDVLLFFARFVRNRAESIRQLDLLLDGRDGMVDRKGRPLFSTGFPYLKSIGQNGEMAFDGILSAFFNSPTGGKLHVRDLKSAAGELSLSLGNAEPFGVINVGDEKTLHGLCEKHPELLATSDQEFGGSLFRQLSHTASRIHLLLGSKKFTEGWNSWRVSAIGLMNMGKKEGSDVIQLFGRGVRLKGWDMTLKRSSALKDLNLGIMQEATEAQRRFLHLVETLDVFGVKADYMASFREYLETEGVNPEPDQEEIIVPILPTLTDLPSKKLKIVRVPEHLNFKRDAPKPNLEPDRDTFLRSPVRVDWYPRIEALSAVESRRGLDAISKDTGLLEARHLAFLDYEALHLGLQRFKTERGFSNLRLDRATIPQLLADPHWYELSIPRQELESGRFESVRTWQQIAEALLKGYCERLYKNRKQGWESEHAEAYDLGPGDPNFEQEYRFLVQAENELVGQIKDLAKQVVKPGFKKCSFAQVNALSWDGHLYSPLVHIAGNSLVTVSPVSLNEGEWQFINDLRSHHEVHPGFFEGKELFVLRNKSKKGIGFFEAGNFYPDFIVWLLVGKQQYLSFVDPKGLRNTQGFDDPKIAFAEKIKAIEARLSKATPGLVLNSFILSTTSFRQIHWWDKLKTPEDFAAAHVLLQKDEPESYIGKMFELILASVDKGE